MDPRDREQWEVIMGYWIGVCPSGNGYVPGAGSNTIIFRSGDVAHSRRTVLDPDRLHEFTDEQLTDRLDRALGR